MKNLLIAIIVACFLPVAATAGQLAARTKTETGWSHVMCEGETSTGVCDLNATNDIYAVVDMYTTVTFSLVDPLDSSAVCEIYAATAYDTTVPTAADISAIGGDKINSTDLSNAQERISFSNISYKYMWVSCTTNDADSQVIMQGSVGPTRIGR